MEFFGETCTMISDVFDVMMQGMSGRMMMRSPSRGHFLEQEGNLMFRVRLFKPIAHRLEYNKC